MKANQQQQYWLQEYNSAGRNWLDYCGYDENKSLAEAVKDLDQTRVTFPARTWRLIVRTDAVLG